MHTQHAAPSSSCGSFLLHMCLGPLGGEYGLTLKCVPTGLPLQVGGKRGDSDNQGGGPRRTDRGARHCGARLDVAGGVGPGACACSNACAVHKLDM